MQAQQHLRLGDGADPGQTAAEEAVGAASSDGPPPAAANPASTAATERSGAAVGVEGGCASDEWQFEARLIPCALTCRLQPTLPALASFFKLAYGEPGAGDDACAYGTCADTALDDEVEDAASRDDIPLLLRSCIERPILSTAAACGLSAQNPWVLVRVRLPHLPLRMLCHLSADAGMVRAANALPLGELISHLTREAAGSLEAADVPSERACAAVEAAWRKLMRGEVNPPAACEETLADDGLLGLLGPSRGGCTSARGGREDKGADVDGADGEDGDGAESEGCEVLLSAFPSVERYHAGLVHTARAGLAAVPTLSGRKLSASPLLRSESDPRERDAACAALLGDACRASADELSGCLLGKLGARLAASTGAASAVGTAGAGDEPRPRVVVHERCELLLLTPAHAMDRLRAAVEAVAEEVERSFELSVRLHVEVTEAT